MLLSALLAAGATARADEGEPPAVERIVWSGTSALSVGQLEGRMLTTPRSWKPWVEPHPFDELTLEEDLERIRDTYRDHGYYDARVASSMAWNPSRTRVTVTVVVEEGEPVRLQRLSIEVPDPPFDATRAESLREALPLEPGAPFGVEPYRAARDELLGRLAEAGYPAARVSGGAEVHLELRQAEVDWRLEPGPLVSFGLPSVLGLAEVEAEVVLAELDFRTGDHFSRSALERSRRRIFDLGLFRTVSLRAVRPEPAEEAPTAPVASEEWPVEIEVEERPLRTVRLGAGYGTDDGPRLLAGWQHRNFLGGARTLDLSARYSPILYGLDGSLQQRRFLHPLVDLELGGSARRETPPAYDANLFGVKASLRRPLWPLWSGHLAYALRFSESKVSSRVSTELDEPPENFLLSSFEVGLRRSTLDDRLDPRRGTRLDLSLESSLRAIGSEMDFLKARAEARAYYPLGPTVLALRAKLATLEPLADASESDVPVVERFYAGGSTSVRGFKFQNLPPLDASDDPLGGLSLAEASLELRFPLWRKLGGVIFVDAGQLNLAPSSFRASDVYYSTGVGFRYSTPIGPIRVDLGYLLNPPSGVDAFRPYLSVGQAF